MSVEPLEVVEATCLTFREVRAAVGVKYRRKRFRVYDNARGWCGTAPENSAMSSVDHSKGIVKTLS